MPSKKSINNAINITLDYFNTKLDKHLGAGDNGIAFLTNDGDIIKFTIDANEAILWNRLKKKSVTGITHLKEVLNLSSRIRGDSLIYVLRAEYVPNPVAPRLAALIRTAKKRASDKTAKDLATMRAKGKVSKETYRNRRTLNLINSFQTIASYNQEFSSIPDLLMDLADKHGGFIFDLQPDNFRQSVKGEVILVDPSVPDLTGDIIQPDKLMYEDRISLSLECDRIYYE